MLYPILMGDVVLWSDSKVFPTGLCFPPSPAGGAIGERFGNFRRWTLPGESRFLKMGP